MEGGIHKAAKTEFMDCFRMTKRQPYILQLAMSAGIGGLLFGYDTGVISGALLYIREDFKEVERNTFLQETIVSMAVAGAIIGAAGGGWANDKLGRRISILIADILFFAGSIIMGLAPNPIVIIVGRIFVGFGVGMASMTAPLYISEASPHQIRGALVSMNGLLITGGQFIAYLINLGFASTKGTWRWMLGIACLPALIQFFLMFMLPESPRWLYRKGRTEEAEKILKKIYPEDEVDHEIQQLKSSVEADIEIERTMGKSSIKEAFASPIVRRGLAAGILCQVAQQFVGINTVMYYSPTIVQLAGYASNKTALALSLITSGLNTIGSIVSMFFVDRFGRRRLMLISLVGIIVCLGLLGGLFFAAAHYSPQVSPTETLAFGNSTVCPGYSSNVSWKCTTCLKSSADCGFCAAYENKLSPGACVINNDLTKSTCQEKREWYTQGCPSNFGWLALVALAAYIISYSPGMGTVPWIINSEIYPLRFRGICGGMAAVANWTSNLVVSLSFLSLTEALGSAGTFLLFCGVSTLALVLIYIVVPETKGLPFEEVEKMLARKGRRKGDETQNT